METVLRIGTCPMCKRPVVINSKGKVPRHGFKVFTAATGEIKVPQNDVECFINSRGYKVFKFDGFMIAAHRLMWLLECGYLPENPIDHINGDKLDNRSDNLREVSPQCNMRNTGNWKTNTTGIKGVSISHETGKWRADITISKKTKFLGYYNDFHNAVLARLAAEQCLGWFGCDSSSPAYVYAVKSGLIKIA